MAIRRWISANRKRLRWGGAAAAGLLLLWLIVWLANDHVHTDLQAVVIMDGPAGKAMVPLDSPWVARDPAGLLERNVSALLARSGRLGKTGEFTAAKVTVAICPVEVRRSNWARVKYQISRLLGSPDPGMAIATVGAVIQESTPLFLRRTPDGAFYVSLKEDRKSSIHADLIKPNDLAGDRITLLLIGRWAGWPQKGEIAPPAKDANH